MNVDSLREILEGVRSGAVEVDAALSILRDLPYEDLGFARLDHHRALRQGVPEVVFCPGKTTEQAVAIVEKLAALLTMLNSCAPGVAVVNIDNGFGAGYLAHVINRLGGKG
jgi:NCAIR mutase (PurE)-related protein